MRHTLLRILAGLVLIIATLHAVAFQYSLYWHFWWYDILVHFLGGLFAGLLSVWIVFYSNYVRAPRITRGASLIVVIGGALVIGVGWEVFERFLGHTWSPEGYWFDTGVDIFMDILGALLGFAMIVRHAQSNIADDTPLV